MSFMNNVISLFRSNDNTVKKEDLPKGDSGTQVKLKDGEWSGLRGEGVGFFAATRETDPNRALLSRVDEGKNWGLFNIEGQLIGTYSRKRDAVRGAQRRGLTV
jgi:hypothetical protein